MRVWVLAAVLLAACGGEERAEPEEATAVHAEDARALLDALSVADTERALRGIDELVADDRPVLAAERIPEEVFPLLDRQIAAVDEAEVTTERGRRVRRELAGALTARRAALARYAEVLARGVIEDTVLLTSIHEQRVADERLRSLHDALTGENAAER